MTEVKIYLFTIINLKIIYSNIYSEFSGEFIANFKDSYSIYSLEYSLMCESSIMLLYIIKYDQLLDLRT